MHALTRPGTLVSPLQKQRAFATFDFAALRAEVQQVELAAAAAGSPVVFAHNDLLSGEPCHLNTGLGSGQPHSVSTRVDAL